MKEKAQCVFWFHDTNSPWVVLQQEGPTPHCGLLVRQFLDATFPKRWIGMDGPTQWPPRSPDITNLDISTRVRDTDTLKARIRDTLVAVTEEVLEKTWREIEYRLDVLRAANGAYVEVY
jgi:hypothetical protein